jgi:hypothetical protein
MSILARFRAVPAAGFLLALICVYMPQADGAEPQDPKTKTDRPALPAKAPPVPAAPQISAEDLAQAEKVSKLLPNPAPAAGLETTAGWTLADWEDPGQLQKIDLVKCPVKTLLRLAGSGGKKGKSLIALTKDLSLPEKGVLRVAVYNPGPEPAQVAVAFWVSAAWVYYESAPAQVAAEAWKVLEFDLAAENFKTEKTKWQHTAKLAKGEAVKRLGVLVMSIPAGKPAAVYLCGLSTGAPTAAQPVPAEGESGPPAALTQRIAKLNALLELVKKAGHDPSYFWPAGHDARLREFLDRRDYGGANGLVNEAFKDYEQFPPVLPR